MKMFRPPQKETRDAYHQPLLQHKQMLEPPSQYATNGRQSPSQTYGTLLDQPHRRRNSHSKKSVHDVPPLEVPQAVMENGFSYPLQQPFLVPPSGLPPVPPPPLHAPRRRANSSGDRMFIVDNSTLPSNLSSRRSSGGNKVRLFSGEREGGEPSSAFAAPPKPSRSRSPISSRHVHPNSAPMPYPHPPVNSSPRQNNGFRVHPLKRFSASEASHRRTHSDLVHEPHHLRRRSTSSGSLKSLGGTPVIRDLPDPRWGGGAGGMMGSGHGGMVANRARTLSGGSQGHVRNGSFSGDPFVVTDGGGGFAYGSFSCSKGGVEVIGAGPGGGGLHRRSPSEASLASSVTSTVSVDQSAEPVRTDLTKSAMFKGVTSKGVVRLQLPKDNFRLLSDRDLESGCVYKRQLVDDEYEYYQDYHITDEAAKLITSPSGCSCTCDTCNHCHTRRKQLPPTYYIMAVRPDLYRRMFDEVTESRNMPCGIFFCGHHEDVQYPSIMIAVVIVSIVFFLMAAATIYVKG